MARTYQPPTVPSVPQDEKRENIRAWTSYRLSEELYKLMRKLEIETLPQMARLLGENANTFKMQYNSSSSTNRQPPLRLLQKIDSLNEDPKLGHIPRDHGTLINIYYIITGKRAFAGNEYLIDLQRKNQELKNQILQEKQEKSQLLATIRLLSQNQESE